MSTLRWRQTSRETINEAGKQPRTEIRLEAQMPIGRDGRYMPHQGVRERARRGGLISLEERRTAVLQRSQRGRAVPYEGPAL